MVSEASNVEYQLELVNLFPCMVKEEDGAGVDRPITTDELLVVLKELAMDKTRETQIYVVHPVWATSTPNS